MKTFWFDLFVKTKVFSKKKYAFLSVERCVCSFLGHVARFWKRHSLDDIGLLIDGVENSIKLTTTNDQSISDSSTSTTRTTNNESFSMTTMTTTTASTTTTTNGLKVHQSMSEFFFDG